MSLKQQNSSFTIKTVSGLRKNNHWTQYRSRIKKSYVFLKTVCELKKTVADVEKTRLHSGMSSSRKLSSNLKNILKVHKIGSQSKRLPQNSTEMSRIQGNSPTKRILFANCLLFKKTVSIPREFRFKIVFELKYKSLKTGPELNKLHHGTKILS